MTQPNTLQARPRILIPAELLAGLSLLVAVCAALDTGVGPAAGAVAVYGLMAMLVLQGLPRNGAGLGWANRVTLLRGMLISYVAGHLVAPPGTGPEQWPIVGLVLAALVLDGLDGWLARYNGEVSDFGARFDMELDALLIAVLCVWLVVTGEMGAWVLALGGMRYGFVLAALRWDYLAAPLPESRRRKAICVWQVAALMLAITPVVGGPIKTGVVVSALVGLALSFALDVRWLYRQATLAKASGLR